MREIVSFKNRGKHRRSIEQQEQVNKRKYGSKHFVSLKYSLHNVLKKLP